MNLRYPYRLIDLLTMVALLACADAAQVGSHENETIARRRASRGLGHV